MDRDYTADPNYRMVMSVFGTRPPFWLSAAKRTDKQIGRSEGAGPNRPFRRRSGARRSARPL